MSRPRVFVIGPLRGLCKQAFWGEVCGGRLVGICQDIHRVEALWYTFSRLEWNRMYRRPVAFMIFHVFLREGKVSKADSLIRRGRHNGNGPEMACLKYP